MFGLVMFCSFQMVGDHRGCLVCVPAPVPQVVRENVWFSTNFYCVLRSLTQDSFAGRIGKAMEGYKCRSSSGCTNSKFLRD